MENKLVMLYAFMAFGFGLILWSLVILRKASRAQSWPRVTGVILYSKIDSRMGQRYPMYRAAIFYEYVVNGERHESEIWRFGAKRSRLSWPSVAARVVARYPSGKSVIVFYNPNNPSDAVLEPGTIDWTGFVLGLFFMIVPATWIITSNSQ